MFIGPGLYRVEDVHVREERAGISADLKHIFLLVHGVVRRKPIDIGFAFGHPAEHLAVPTFRVIQPTLVFCLALITEQALTIGIAACSRWAAAQPVVAFLRSPWVLLSLSFARVIMN